MPSNRQPDCKNHDRCPVRYLCQRDGQCISADIDRQLEESNP